MTWSIAQKTWASSCWKRRTLVSPVKVPDSSFLWRTPKSASLRGSSRHERGLWLNIRLQDDRALKCIPRWQLWLGRHYSFTKKVFTSGRGSSWASEQRRHLPRGRRTCFHCSAASDQMSPTACCYRCWGRLLPEILFSSTHPKEKQPNQRS